MDINSIDVVLLWVDSEDKNWQKSYETYSSSKISVANHACRFRSWDNLEYIFRGIEQFMPWVRKVHFVTQGHIPAWLNLNNERLNFVTHCDIFDDLSHLPTFNSNAIELNFNKIKGLAEKFILFNDDLFVLNELPQERFFKNDLPVDFLIQSFKRKGGLYKLIKPQNYFDAKAINNNIDYLNLNYDKKKLDSDYYYSKNYSLKSKLFNYFYNMTHSDIPWLKLNHVPQPHLKSTLNMLWESNSELMKCTSKIKFRTENDTTQYLFRYINLVLGNFYPNEYQDYLSKEINISSDMEDLLYEISDINLLSVSDTKKLTSSEFEKSKIILKKYLTKILPNESSFEI